MSRSSLIRALIVTGWFGASLGCVPPGGEGPHDGHWRGKGDVFTVDFDVQDDAVSQFSLESDVIASPCLYKFVATPYAPLTAGSFQFKVATPTLTSTISGTFKGSGATGAIAEFTYEFHCAEASLTNGKGAAATWTAQKLP